MKCKLCLKIIFSISVMNEQTENNSFLLLEKFHSKTQKFAVKSNSRSTDWIVDPFTQVNSLEHIAKKILTLNLPLIGRISQFFFKTLSRIYKTSRKHL